MCRNFCCIKNHIKAIARHADEDDRMKHPVIDSIGRTQDTWIINESGLYALVLGSEMKEAKRFKRTG